ncbi:hypothetical protein F5Y10DRAFT_294463 [Nemania abortiva]|nr:hypothetical protein F5Y10DRAFT_294463 [Nemania abortiva]
MPIALIPLIGEAIEAVTLGTAISGSVARYCETHPHVHGCVNKRGILNTGGVPRMQVEGKSVVGLCNVPQYNFDQCHDQISRTHVETSVPGPGKAQFDGVPPACMDLATVLTGSCGSNGPGLTVCGSACLHYTGLTDEQLATLSNAINGK